MTFRTVIQSASLMSLVSIALAQVPAAPPAQPPAPPRARGPSLAVAVEMAQVAQATCMARGFKTTVLVVDSADVPVVMLGGDGATERTQAVAASKAAAAIRYNTSSGEVTNRAQTDAKLAEEIKADPKIGMPRQGALLLKVGNDTIGALAVSGAPGGDKDEACGQVALDKVKDRLR
jgi:uncharacterized protein GlcG (DUF336 family)